jgi:hypothetical protein
MAEQQSIICAVTGRTIKCNEDFYYAYVPGMKVSLPVAAEVVEKIPFNEKIRTQQSRNIWRIDFHRGMFVSGCRFSEQEFLFSIGEEAARKYLPRLAEELPSHFRKSKSQPQASV